MSPGNIKMLIVGISTFFAGLAMGIGITLVYDGEPLEPAPYQVPQFIQPKRPPSRGPEDPGNWPQIPRSQKILWQQPAGNHDEEEIVSVLRSIAHDVAERNINFHLTFQLQQFPVTYVLRLTDPVNPKQLPIRYYVIFSVSRVILSVKNGTGTLYIRGPHQGIFYQQNVSGPSTIEFLGLQDTIPLRFQDNLIAAQMEISSDELRTLFNIAPLGGSVLKPESPWALFFIINTARFVRYLL